MSDAREKELLESIERLKQENELLRQKLDLLIRRLHGPSSEKVAPSQLDFLMNNLDEQGKPEGGDSKKNEDAADSKPKRNRRKPRKPRIPDNLPVGSREVIEPQEVLDDPKAWRRIGEEVSTYLDFQPGHFFKRQIVRPKYVRIKDPEQQAPIIAPLPNQWLDRVMAAPGLMTHIAISKYVDHLPLYRQEQIFKQRFGVEIPRNTMARWIDIVADSLKMVYLTMAGELFGKKYLQVDETPIKYLDPGSGKTAQGYFWAYSNPTGDVLFDWRTGRGHECLLEMLTKANSKREGPAYRWVYQGMIQCDGYSAYKTLTNKVEGIQLVGCWAHVRRKFNDALQDFPKLAGWIMRQIQNLYAIEAKLREDQAGPRQRKAARLSQSQPILRRIKKALMIYKGRASVLPESSLGKAVAYAMGEWNHLGVYIEQGQIEIDNNLVENAIRPIALGKKNWLFVGGADTGERSAIIYSVVESCRRRGIDPHEYLADVLPRLANAKSTDQLAGLTPAGWADQRARLPQAAERWTSSMPNPRPFSWCCMERLPF